ncbi:hypothetical protein PU99_06110 [Pseudomonas putida]|jgi:hypothetical protein|nr:hypothetical protein PU99_06110 [Pseudomonas putida]OMQ32937.1 hypothetical protein BKX96_22700 [Pseudomonas putida]
MTSSNLMVAAIFQRASTLFRAAGDSMTAALKDVDAHAQTDGRPAASEPVQDTQVSSKRPPKKLAIGLMPF